MTKIDGLYKSKAAKKAKRRISLGGIGGAIAAFAMIGAGVAFAAMALDSNEATAKADAGQAQALKLTDASFNKPLFPGTSTDLKVLVTNPNPFPATVKQIVISGNSTTTCNPAQLTGPASDVGTVSGLNLNLTNPVVVGADGGQAWVTVPKAVKLSSDATAGCEVVAKFKVAGTGAGN